MKTVKGTRDFLPEEMLLRQQIIEKIRAVFENFGFQPMETPALEAWKTLSTKGAGGDEILKESYNFEDKGGRMIGLRYDLTVPLARLISENPNTPLPFKRYQIGKVWRYGDVAKGRLREFLQADVDIVGSNSSLADAEVIACAITCFKELGFKDFYIRLNTREKLSEVIEKNTNIAQEKVIDVARIIDKKDKIGEEGVREELSGTISTQATATVLANIRNANEMAKKINKNGLSKTEREILSYLKIFNIDSKVKIDRSLARGLDYYTGPIFEVFAGENIGSLGGGGRYDNLIELFSGRNIPATGISFGIDRIMEIINLNVENRTKVFVVAVNDKVRKNVLEIVKSLREKAVSTDYDMRSRSLSGQLKYVSSMGIPFSVIVGEKELEKKSVKIRNMKNGKEELVKIKDLYKKF